METVITPPQKPIGHLIYITINVTEPLKMNVDNMEMKNINLYAGQNNSGKSFVLVNAYVMSYIISAIVHTKIEGPMLNNLAQFTFDKCFDNQNIDGIIEMKWSAGTLLAVTLLKGKVHSVICSGTEGITIAPPATFMSSPMRTFSAIKFYLKLRKIYSDESDSYEILVTKLLNDYKLYDVMYLESLIHKLPKDVPATILKSLKESFDVTEDIRTFEVDLDKCDFYVTIGDEKQIKYMSTYSSGYQSIFNIFLGQI